MIGKTDVLADVLLALKDHNSAFANALVERSIAYCREIRPDVNLCPTPCCFTCVNTDIQERLRLQVNSLS